MIKTEKLIAVITLLIFIILSPGILSASTSNISLIVIDSDSYLAHLAVDKLDLGENLNVKVFCLADLKTFPEATAFVSESQVIMVDIMDDKLSTYIIENKLIAGKTVFALRGSKDDQGLKDKGFIFNDELSEYYANLGEENIQNMIKRAASLTIKPDLAYSKLLVNPENQIYHPETTERFENYKDYISWYKTRPGYKQDKPTLGLMLYSAALVPGQIEAVDELIKKIESDGFNIIAAFGKDIEIMDKYFLDDNRKARVDAILSFTLKMAPTLNEHFRQTVLELDVPIFNAINFYSLNIDEWKKSEQGITPLDIVWTMATPEMSALIEPTPIMGKTEEKASNGGGLIYRYKLIPEMIDHILPRIHNWIKLRKKSNNEKKVAILYYNHSRGKQNIGASYLNVFRSLEEIMTNLKKLGYNTPKDLKISEDDLKDQILRSGRNIGSWAPGELDALLLSDQVLRLPINEYKKWFAELPEDFQKNTLDQWGQPESSDLMIKDGNIIIPLVRAGNIVLLPEPARGLNDDAQKLYHDPKLMPHHQYIATYLWLKHGFNADVMVHLGTHATYEWLPGKQAGLALSDPPEIMMTDIPNVYPYIVDDVGEGLQAKRRGRGVLISHLTPELKIADGYQEYAELKNLIDQYERAESFNSATTETYLAEIQEMASKMGLDKDLELKEITDRDAVQSIDIYLETLATGYIPYGLHTFGRTSEESELNDTAEAVIKSNDGLNIKEVKKNLSISGPNEMENFLRALEGRYIPASEGNDPVRNPLAIPTGRNFYGLSPNRLPTQAAWALGQKAADDIIAQYIEENDGKYPDKIAVVLWAVESLRNEGLNESTILSLIGVEPIWNPSGQVLGSRPIPAAKLNRPRIDVAINASGLYRDLFPEKILFIDNAIRQAAVQDDIENFISKNDQRIKQTLMDTGLSEEEAGRFSRARIFSEAPGTYGNRVSELTSASGLWDDEKAISDVYRRQTGFAYGNDYWGAPAQASLDANLKDAKVAWHSVSSNVYGVMDNDDMYMYLGGLSQAIRNLSGQAPRTLIANQRISGEVTMEVLGKFVGQEMRARYLNPKWIVGMKAEKYAGAREMANYVEYLWGWQVTTPESVSKESWEQTYEVYVEDKYGLELKEFLDKESPWAYQSLTGRMLESTRKGYWETSDEIKQKLSVEYAMSVITRGLACCDHTCNNPQFHQMVMNIVSIPGVMSPELVAEFKLAVETAGQKTLEEMVETRENLLKNIGEKPQAKMKEAGPEDANTKTASVKGLKMEKVEENAEKTSVSSSGVEWFASIFVLVLVTLFFIGLKKAKKN